jgi:hypothetical protein
MTKNALDKKKTDIQDNPTQSFYADRVIGIGLGVAVSKLMLGNEVAPGQYIQTLNLIMPTSSLIDALDSLQKSIHEDETNKTTLLAQIDSLKKQYDNL